MEKSRKWNWLRAIIFLIVLAIVVYHVQWHFGVAEPRGHMSEYNYFKEKPGSLDAVFIGGSSVYESYQPLFGWDEYGIAVWNYATSGVPILAIKHYLIEARKTQPNALFIISLNPFKKTSAKVNPTWIHHAVDYLPLSLNTLQMIRDLTENMFGEATLKDKLEYYFPIYRFHSRWDELKPWVFGIADYDYKSSDVSGVFTSKVTDVSQVYSISNEKSEVPDDVLTAFMDLLDYCDENQVNVLFVKSPQVLSEGGNKRMNTLEEIVALRNYPCLNLLENVDVLGLDMKMDFYDKVHTNIHGSLKFSHYLGQYLIDHYGFEDKRGQKDWASWDQSAEQYVNWMNYYALDFELEHAERADLDAPKAIRTSGKGKSIKITWDAVEGADGYAVYRKAGKAWKLVKTYDKDTLSHTDNKLSASTKYTYTVVPFQMEGDVTKYGRFNVSGVSRTTGGN